MCTCFRLTTTDGTIIVGRSMEYALDLASQIRIFPKDIQRSSLAPDGRPGLQWSATYGAVGFDMRGLDFCCDGMNERGLTLPPPASQALRDAIVGVWQEASEPSSRYWTTSSNRQEACPKWARTLVRSAGVLPAHLRHCPSVVH